MSKGPVDTTGIFTLFFREAGYFWQRTFEWSEAQAKEDRALDVEDEKRRLTDAQYRKSDAEARLLEQIRLAKADGLDVDAILRSIREDVR
jgi:hypothetical protein